MWHRPAGDAAGDATGEWRVCVGACIVLAACSMLTIVVFMVMFPLFVALNCVLQTSASSLLEEALHMLQLMPHLSCAIRTSK